MSCIEQPSNPRWLKTTAAFATIFRRLFSPLVNPALFASFISHLTSRTCLGSVSPPRNPASPTRIEARKVKRDPRVRPVGRFCQEQKTPLFQEMECTLQIQPRKDAWPNSSGADATREVVD